MNPSAAFCGSPAGEGAGLAALRVAVPVGLAHGEQGCSLGFFAGLCDNHVQWAKGLWVVTVSLSHGQTCLEMKTFRSVPVFSLTLAFRGVQVTNASWKLSVLSPARGPRGLTSTPGWTVSSSQLGPREANSAAHDHSPFILTQVNILDSLGRCGVSSRTTSGF